MFAAAFGIFLLAVLSRLLAAIRRGADQAWARRTAELLAERYGTTTHRAVLLPELAMEQSSSASSVSDEKQVALPASGLLVPRPHGLSYRTSAPFIAAHDIPRGLMTALQQGIAYFLMLAGAQLPRYSIAYRS